MRLDLRESPRLAADGESFALACSRAGVGRRAARLPAMAKAANGRNLVWQCYVSGIDPEDPDAHVKAALP